MVCLYFACLRKHRLGDMVIFLINLCPETSKSQDPRHDSRKFVIDSGFSICAGIENRESS